MDLTHRLPDKILVDFQHDIDLEFFLNGPIAMKQNANMSIQP